MAIPKSKPFVSPGTAAASLCIFGRTDGAGTPTLTRSNANPDSYIYNYQSLSLMDVTLLFVHAGLLGVSMSVRTATLPPGLGIFGRVVQIDPYERFFTFDAVQFSSDGVTPVVPFRTSIVNGQFSIRIDYLPTPEDF